MRVIITGGSGFVGTHLGRRLLNENNEIIVMDRVEPSLDIKDKITFVNTPNIESKKVTSLMFNDVDVIYHLAAKLPIERGKLDEYRKVNVIGTSNVIEMAINNNIPKIIHISSSAVYGDCKSPIDENSLVHPIENYGRSKLEAELLCRHYRKENKIDISIVRPRAILGKERLGAYYMLFLLLKNNKPIPCIGRGNNKVQLISVNDLVDLLVRIPRHSCKNQDYNVGTDKFGTLNETIQDLAAKIGSTSRMVYFPSMIGKEMCRIINKIFPIAEWHYKLVDKDFYFDTTKARNLLGWYPKDSNVDMLKDSYLSFLTMNERNNSSIHKSKVDIKLLKYILK